MARGTVAMTTREHVSVFVIPHNIVTKAHDIKIITATSTDYDISYHGETHPCFSHESSNAVVVLRDKNSNNINTAIVVSHHRSIVSIYLFLCFFSLLV